MKFFAKSKTAFAVAALMLSATSVLASTGGDSFLGAGNPLLQNASPPLSEDGERLQLLGQAREAGDLGSVIELANPAELTQILEETYGKSPEGEARMMPAGSSVTGFKARIDINLTMKPETGNKQFLVMSYMNPNGTSGTFKALGSGGARTNSGGTMSDLLKNHCFTVDSHATSAVTVHGDTLVQPVFFRGKRGPGNSELPGTLTYAIHGLLGEGYVSKLGGPASHGCFRVSRPDAKKIRDTVLQVGPSNVVICVK